MDYPIWDMPGGVVDDGETFSDAAVREAKEETGFEIEILSKVGTYHRVKKNDIQHIFCGKIIGGKSIGSGPETRELKWFSFDKLPLFMVPNRRRQIKDYLKGIQNEKFTLR